MIPGALSIWRRRVVARMTETFPGRSARRETTGYRRLGGADDCRPIAARLSNGVTSDHLGNNSPSRTHPPPREETSMRRLATAFSLSYGLAVVPGVPGRGERGPLLN